MDKLNNTNTVLGIIGTVFAVGLSLYGLLNNSLSNNPLDKSIVGVWSTKYNYPTRKGESFVTSTTSFFENGKYNIVGTLTIATKKDSVSDRLSFEINGAGEWASDGDILLTTLNSLKSSPIIPKTGSPEIDLILAKKINSLPLKIEDYLASGLTQKSKILNINSSSAKLITNDPLGNDFVFLWKKGYNIS